MGPTIDPIWHNLTQLFFTARCATANEEIHRFCRFPQIQRGSATHFSRKPGETKSRNLRSLPHRNGWHFLGLSASGGEPKSSNHRGTEDTEEIRTGGKLTRPLQILI